MITININKMKPSDFKQFIITSLDVESNPMEVAEMFENVVGVCDFSDDFEDKVFEKLFGKSIEVDRESEFIKNLSLWVNRVAITGVAAILILLISIFFTEGDSFSLNSLMGLSDVYEEGMVCLLGGL